MPKPRVYIETTIPNFYYETRTEPELVARRNWTREWWADAAQRYELVTSAVVLDELASGTSNRVRLRQELLRAIPVLAPEPVLAGIVEVYIRHRVMPTKPNTNDAMHLALASHHECDFIVTWDCKHLANPRKATHIRQINAVLGLHVPELVTPQDLLRRRK